MSVFDKLDRFGPLQKNEFHGLSGHWTFDMDIGLPVLRSLFTKGGFICFVLYASQSINPG